MALQSRRENDDWKGVPFFLINKVLPRFAGRAGALKMPGLVEVLLVVLEVTVAHICFRATLGSGP